MIRTQKLNYGRHQNAHHGDTVVGTYIVFADIFIAYVLTAAAVGFGAMFLSGSAPDSNWLLVVLFALISGFVFAIVATIPTGLLWLLMREAFGESLPVCLLYGVLMSSILTTLLRGDFGAAGLSSSLFAAPVGLVGGFIYWALGPRIRKGDSHD
ncbi:hypothetical protein [Kordiimonas gwangyangensis]|uniref:hypothetical protein n=1 Tax=Kordiimonas gwangyangensis TaxID=288022 RepID=UPI00036D2361|nr:hypothetical protein [Kordiimonas gwangyangensis]